MITIVIKRSLTKKTKKSLVFSVPRKIKRYSKDHGNKITNTVVYARPSQNPIIKYGLSFFSGSLFKFYAQNPIPKAYNKPCRIHKLLMVDGLVFRWDWGLLRIICNCLPFSLVFKLSIVIIASLNSCGCVRI